MSTGVSIEVNNNFVSVKEVKAFLYLVFTNRVNIFLYVLYLLKAIKIVLPFDLHIQIILE